MPKFDNMMEKGQTASGFAYSKTGLKGLTASEYTLVSLCLDVSGSTEGFRTEMEKAVKEIIKACEKSPRRDNLLIRVTKFGSTLDEVHGFKLLSTISLTDYDGSLSTLGLTALYQADLESVEALGDYGKQLMDQSFLANGVAFTITDGADDIGGVTPKKIKAAKEAAVEEEHLESLTSVLICIGQDQRLTDFGKEGGFTQVEQISAATSAHLAKLAAFVSKSISSASQALGTGGASQPVAFTV